MSRKSFFKVSYKTDREHLLRLASYTKIFGLSPKYSKARNRFVKWTSENIYVVIFSLTFHLLCISVILASLFDTNFLVHRIMEYTMNGIVTLLNVLCTSKITYFYKDIYLNIYNKILQFESKFKYISRKYNRSWGLAIEVVVLFFMLIYALILILRACILKLPNHSATHHVVYFVATLQRCYVFANVMIIHNLVIIIKKQVKHINLTLTNILTVHETKALNLSILQQMFVKIVNQMNRLNKSFGLVIFFMCLTDIIGFLNSFNYLIVRKRIGSSVIPLISIGLWMSICLVSVLCQANIL